MLKKTSQHDRIEGNGTLTQYITALVAAARLFAAATKEDKSSLS